MDDDDDDDEHLLDSDAAPLTPRPTHPVNEWRSHYFNVHVEWMNF